MSIGLAIGTHLGRVGGAGNTIAYLHRSTFTAPGGTALASYTPEVGAAWVPRSGTWTINGNGLRKTANVGSDYAVTEAGAADVTVTATITVGAGRTEGVIVREGGSPAAGFWMLVPNVSAWTLYEGFSGLTARASGGAMPVAGTTIVVKVTAKGSTITAQIDGVQILSYGAASTNQTSTKHGVRVYSPNDGSSKITPFTVVAA